jgi:hypothetical protein
MGLTGSEFRERFITVPFSDNMNLLLAREALFPILMISQHLKLSFMCFPWVEPHHESYRPLGLAVTLLSLS